MNEGSKRRRRFLAGLAAIGVLAVAVPATGAVAGSGSDSGAQPQSSGAEAGSGSAAPGFLDAQQSQDRPDRDGDRGRDCPKDREGGSGNDGPGSSTPDEGTGTTTAPDDVSL